jgi:hypothetical protein
MGGSLNGNCAIACFDMKPFAAMADLKESVWAREA